MKALNNFLRKPDLDSYLPSTEAEALELLNLDFYDLLHIANRIRERYCDNRILLCGIVNAKSGRCSEDCRFCAQSAHYNTNIPEYGMLGAEDILSKAIIAERNGAKRFGIVISGKGIFKTEEKGEKMKTILKTMCFLILVGGIMCAGIKGYAYNTEFQLEQLNIYNGSHPSDEIDFDSTGDWNTYQIEVKTGPGNQPLGKTDASDISGDVLHFYYQDSVDIYGSGRPVIELKEGNLIEDTAYDYEVEIYWKYYEGMEALSGADMLELQLEARYDVGDNIALRFNPGMNGGVFLVASRLYNSNEERYFLGKDEQDQWTWIEDINGVPQGTPYEITWSSGILAGKLVLEGTNNNTPSFYYGIGADVASAQSDFSNHNLGAPAFSNSVSDTQYYTTFGVQFNPEPSTILMFLVGILGIGIKFFKDK